VDNFAQPSDLGQFVPVGGRGQPVGRINLTKVVVVRVAARPGECVCAGWVGDLGTLVSLWPLTASI
jgi:hypothetical protein